MRAQLHRGDKSVTSRCNLEIFLRRFDLAGETRTVSRIKPPLRRVIFVHEFPRRDCLYSTFHSENGSVLLRFPLS